MADKVIRVAGRFENDDGTISQAKGVKVRKDGTIDNSKEVLTRSIITSEVLIGAGKEVELANISPQPNLSLNGRVSRALSKGDISFYVSSREFGTNAHRIEIPYTALAGRFKTNSFNALSEDSKVFAKNNTDEPITITHLVENTEQFGDGVYISPTDDRVLHGSNRLISNHIVNRHSSEVIPLLPNVPYTIDIESPRKVFNISGRVHKLTTLKIEYLDVVIGSAFQRDKPIIVEAIDGRFVTNPITSGSDEGKLVITNIGESEVSLSDVFINDVHGNSVISSGSGGGMSVEDEDGETISLSATKDDNGKGVLRTVDSAPHAYDIEKDVIKVVNVPMEDEKDLSPHMTYLISWDDDEYDGVLKKVIDLNGGIRNLAQGTKGVLMYKGIEDGHSIYLETRIGGSGDMVIQDIVRDGTGANFTNTKRVKIPDDIFPVMDFSETDVFKGTNNLVVEATSGDLSRLKLYLVMM